LYNLGFPVDPVDHIPVEPLHSLLMLLQVSLPKAVSFNVTEDREEQFLDLRGQSLQFGVERVIPQVVVDVSNQVDQALLLPAVHGVVAGVEIGDQHSGVPIKNFLYDVCFACVGQPEDNMDAVRKNPDIMLCSLNVDLRLIDVDERTRFDSLQ